MEKIPMSAKKYILSIIWAGIFIVSGCTYIQRPNIQKGNEEQDYTIPEAAQEIPQSLIPEKEPPKPQKQKGKPQFADITSKPEQPKRESGWGYRIQIYSSMRQEEAESVAAVAHTRLEEKVYVEFHPPYYKVRVGNCWTADEAAELLEKVKKAGFPDAWVVRATVVNEE